VIVKLSGIENTPAIIQHLSGFVFWVSFASLRENRLFPFRGHKKTGWSPVFFVKRETCLQSFYPLVQAAFLTGRLVFVNQALICGAVDNWYRQFEGFGSTLFIAGSDRFLHVFNVGAHGAATGCIVLPMRFRLTSALAGLCCIGQSNSPKTKIRLNLKELAILMPKRGVVNSQTQARKGEETA
jgi:hypothetical protein